MRKPLRRTLIALAASTAVLVAGTAALAYAAFLRAPENSPSAYQNRAKDPSVRQVLLAVGSSSTRGTLSTDWVGARTRLGPATAVINAGVNGDTTTDLRHRLDTDVLACQPTAVTLLIGANDARDQVPLPTFTNNLTNILTRLKPTRTAILSLPPQGENLTSQANQALTPYNQAIKDLAVQHNITYLPLNEALTTLLREHNGTPTAQDFTFLDTFAIAIQRYLLGRSWNTISSTNGLHLLTDNLHLNDRAGEVVTTLVTTWLSTPDPAR
ncbi:MULTISPECIES: GDSL-type esterase/lipase family protein [unclassified Crossiella]|uniref:SGNH/GDSL hydrolase family protein n=1 Tax=unclassified Crossiella TaxID=2620835 RepID=UPI001FFFE72D|nr:MULTISPECIES: GDSL-type esterase/lipase family protein [unclassified Crossiella]MCK2237376.1 GDSL-type esterase/lipase family protein [Crossiella sp. S99.2]MCK2251031.1 GDSL-type esterase/lipase family protein [Crossiella sp. S99.1]